MAEKGLVGDEKVEKSVKCSRHGVQTAQKHELVTELLFPASGQELQPCGEMAARLRDGRVGHRHLPSTLGIPRTPEKKDVLEIGVQCKDVALKGKCIGGGGRGQPRRQNAAIGSGDRLIDNGLTRAKEPSHKTLELGNVRDSGRGRGRRFAIAFTWAVMHGGKGVKRLFIKQGGSQWDAIQVD
ncbi:hypothetical protein C359_06005 [Cryptococcus neoformans Bt120]|nr:hypothetical protein C359_06005 [Cryptococcus neoformans var. grubii Bt120]